MLQSDGEEGVCLPAMVSGLTAAKRVGVQLHEVSDTEGSCIRQDELSIIF